MDTDVAPDNRKPLAALSKISGRKVGEKEAATEKIDELSKPVPIIFFRGMRSATNMVVKRPKTIPKVEKEIAKLLSLAERIKSLAKSGNRQEEVTIDEEGNGKFTVSGSKLAVWVVKI